MEIPIAVVFMPFPRFVVPTSNPPPIAVPKLAVPTNLLRTNSTSCEDV